MVTLRKIRDAFTGRVFKSDYNENTTDIENAINSLQGQVDNLVISGDSSPAAAQAVVDETGYSYSSLKERLDEENKQIKDIIFYDEISYTTYTDSVTGVQYRITYIPNKDKLGNLIPLKHGYQNDLMNSGVGETARSFATRHTATFAANASTWNTGTGLIQGVQIQDGIVLQDAASVRYTLGIKADNTLVSYPPSTNAAAILADGCVNAVSGFFPMIISGNAVDPTIYHASGDPDNPHARQVIAQLSNKDILFLTCEGNDSGSAGMTFADVIRILQAKGVTFAYNLDGGGSASTIVNGMMINSPIDDGGKTERKVADFLYVVKDAADAEKMKDFMSNDGYLKKKIFDLTQDLYDKYQMNQGYIQLLGAAGFMFQGIESWDGSNKNTKLTIAKDKLQYYDFNANGGAGATPFQVLTDGTLSTLKGTFATFFKNPKTVTDLNSMTESGIYWCLGTAANAPATTSSWGILHIQVDTTNALQVAIPFHASLNNLMSRRTNTSMSDWYAWRQI